MATREEINQLKISWRNDPIWDIEDTPGFEEHREELIAYQKQVDAEWKEQHDKEIHLAAQKMGIPDNLKLAEYILELEKTVTKLNNNSSATPDIYDEIRNHVYRYHQKEY